MRHGLADLPLRLKLLGSFGLILVVLLGLATAAFRTTVAEQETAEAVAHSARVIALADQTLGDLVDMQTSYRGFLLTGQEEFLAPVEAASAGYLRGMAELEQATADNPAQLARWREIRGAAERWQRETVEAGTALRRQVTASAAVPLAVSAHVGSGEGRRQFEAVRALFAEATRAEQQLLAARRTEAARASEALLHTLVVGTALAILLAAAIVIALTRDLTAGVGRLMTSAEQIAGGDLTRRIGEERGDELGVAARAFDRMADRLEATIGQLERQKTELERSNRELQDFASVASHDLQEPLRKVRAFGDRLVARFGDALPPEGHDYLARMQDAAARMSTLIDDLLAFSRVTTRAQPFVCVDLGLVAAQVCADLEVRIADSGGTVVVEPLPAVEADPLQMRQLLQNLIANGLKFHRPGVPPRVRVSAERDETAGPTGGWVRLAVEDNGIGFEEKYLDRIFTIFQRLHGRGDYEGTGVGLAVCRKIVERHEGTITARSVPGEGACFLVTLPVRHDSAAAAAAPAPTPLRRAG
jgi:signal transduction histidine kinase